MNETNKEWDEEKMKVIVSMYIQLIKKRNDIYCNELRYVIEKYESIPILLSQKDTEWREKIDGLINKIEKNDLCLYSGDVKSIINLLLELK